MHQTDTVLLSGCVFIILFEWLKGFILLKKHDFMEEKMHWSDNWNYGIVFFFSKIAQNVCKFNYYIFNRHHCTLVWSKTCRRFININNGNAWFTLKMIFFLTLFCVFKLHSSIQNVFLRVMDVSKHTHQVSGCVILSSL